MTWILTCGWKWLVAVLAPFGLIGGVIAAAIILTGAVLVPVWGMSKLADRFTPKAARAVVVWLDSTPSTKLVIGIGLVLVGFAVYTSPQFMMDIFDCDTCLPEAMRDKCEADRAAAEARDRAQFLTLCERWNWTECPAVSPPEGTEP